MEIGQKVVANPRLMNEILCVDFLKNIKRKNPAKNCIFVSKQSLRYLKRLGDDTIIRLCAEGWADAAEVQSEGEGEGRADGPAAMGLGS